MTLQERREKAESIARKARRLGFRGVGFCIMDSYGRQIFTEGKLDELLAQYRDGDLVSIDTLLSLGRSKVKVQEA